MGVTEVLQVINNFKSRYANSSKSKVIIISCIGFILAIGIFLIGFFSGSSSSRSGSNKHHKEDLVEFSPSASLRGLPALKWNGNCPQSASRCPQNYQGNPPLLLISLDGLQSGFLKRTFTRTINKIAQCGVKADFMYPVYPSKTFPNHFSIVTGLYPASHGIIDNSMYDPVRRKLFKLKDPEHLKPYWYQKEPIWVTATKQGKKTASFFWPGSEVKINNTLSTYNRKYTGRVSYDSRVDQILEWLDLPPSTRPSLITLYFNQPDNMAHSNGPKSSSVNQALQSLDQMIERLFSGLQKRNIVDCVNVVIVSDHGMTDVSCNQVVDIGKYVDPSSVFFTAGPLGRLRPKGKGYSAVDDVVSKLRCQSPHMRVYRKEQMPVRMHFADNARIEPIILDMDSKWTVVSKSTDSQDGICTGGAHGYDNIDPDMSAIFLAHGPSFKKHTTVRPFLNTELYELFCELLDVVPNPNNGTRGSLHSILKSPKSSLPQQVEPRAPITATVPENQDDYNLRVHAANCSCRQTNHQVNDASHQTLHLPFGVPFSQDNSTVRLLHHSDFVSGFDLKYRIPSWSSFNLDGTNDGNGKSVDVCWTGDARIPFSDTPTCSDFNNTRVQKNYILQRPLFPNSFSSDATKEESALITNSIPKSQNHSRILERKMNHMLGRWSTEHGPINVITGSAFDLHGTGIRPEVGKIMRLHETFGPIVVPTHIFVIATWCSTKVTSLSQCDSSKLEVQAYLLPNHPYPQNCESGESVISRNVARVVDIEKLTGISFFTALPTYDAIRLRAAMPIVKS